MTDPTDPLAHLYEDFADDVDEDLDLPVVEVSLDGLNAEVDPERDEQISERDVDELAILVKARLDADHGLPDREAAELGLGDLSRADLDDPDSLELVLNATGRAVLARLVDERFPGLRRAENGETGS